MGEVTIVWFCLCVCYLKSTLFLTVIGTLWHWKMDVNVLVMYHHHTRVSDSSTLFLFKVISVCVITSIKTSYTSKWHLQHLEWREFVPQGSQMARSKWDNYCHSSCIMTRWPMFTTSLLNIDPNIAQRLLPACSSQVVPSL